MNWLRAIGHTAATAAITGLILAALLGWDLARFVDTTIIDTAIVSPFWAMVLRRAGR